MNKYERVKTVKRENIVREKSYNLALRIIKLYQYLVKEHSEYILTKQILRCGTSIGANIEESIGAQSKKDFISKLFIAYKESRETQYWLRLLRDSGYLQEKLANSLLKDAEEISRLLTAILKSSQKTVDDKKTNY